MERMIVFCMLLFCSSAVLTASPYDTVKYKQILKTIEHLNSTVKDKGAELVHTPENPVDGCRSMAVACFQKGVLKLQPENSQVNSTFTRTVKILRKFTFREPGKQCESSCESYEKKTPREFLKSFAKLMKEV
ncbi:Interleukin-21, partial [Acanthisitta chloris]